MMRAVRTIILALTALWFLGAPSRTLGDDGKRNLDATGTYSIKVAGCAKGKGKATRSGDKISISASVTDEDGNKGELSATDLAVNNKNHFSGTGTMFGQKVTLYGRLDATTPDDAAINAQRVVCTFTTADGQHGRIAGYVPDSGGQSAHKGKVRDGTKSDKGEGKHDD